MIRVVVATRNPGKIREFAAALDEAGITVAGLDSLDLPDGFDPEETGDTFEANARIKAEAYSAHTDLAVLADDSGLEVDALDGAPGVRSARYGGPGLDDAGRTRKVLDDVRDVPDAERTARFRCVLAVARQGMTLATFDGVVEGRLTHEPVGANGFGYDPIFFHDELGRTFAEVDRAVKQGLSHRGGAIRRFVAAVRAGHLAL